MNTRKEFELLADIAALLRKYGPDTFESLAVLVQSPGFSRQLADILTTVSRTPVGFLSRRRKGPAGPRPKPLRGVLQTLKAESPEKYSIVSSFHSELIAGEILPTMRDIKGFAAEIGFRELKATSRDKAVAPLIRVLATMPLEEMEKRLMKLARQGPGDRALEGWTGVILKRDSSAK